MLKIKLDKGGIGKLKSFWEQQIYGVVEKHVSLPVYKIRALDSNKMWTIDRNLMMGCNDFNSRCYRVITKTINQVNSEYANTWWCW